MKFFVDTANLEDIREAAGMGVLDGVTTNPSLVKAEGNVDFRERVLEICQVVGGDVSAEVTATEFDGMMEEARALTQIHDNVVVKIPLIKAGIKALRALDEEGIKTNCTLCFSPTQALVAAKAGADYISPFIGRIDDISSDGMTLIEEMLLADAGASGGEGGGRLHQSLHRADRRHLLRWDDAHRRNPPDLRQLRV